MMGTTMKSKANEDLQGLDEGTVDTRNSIVGDRRDSLLDMSLPQLMPVMKDYATIDHDNSKLTTKSKIIVDDVASQQGDAKLVIS